MKRGILFLLLAVTVTAKAQSLKDLLYSGKLKMDTNSVIRKTDDLKSKIDTSQKKAAEPEKTRITAVSGDSLVKTVNPKADSVAAVMDIKDSVATPVAGPKDNNAPAKSNNKIWKEYT